MPFGTIGTALLILLYIIYWILAGPQTPQTREEEDREYAEEILSMMGLDDVLRTKRQEQPPAYRSLLDSDCPDERPSDECEHEYPWDGVDP